MIELNMPVRWQRRIFRFALLGAIICLCLSAVLTFLYRASAANRVTEAKEVANGRATSIVERIESSLEEIEPSVLAAVNALAAQLSEGPLADELLDPLLKNIFDENKDVAQILEVGVAWDPGHNPKEPGTRWAPHYGLKGGREQHFQIDYDYTGVDWYLDTKSLGRPMWGEPYFGETTKKWASGYMAPFFTEGKEFAGVVRINFDLEKIRHLVDSVSRPEGGDAVLHSDYVILLSKRGKIVSHPLIRLWGETISELTDSDGVLGALSEKFSEDHSSSLGSILEDPLTGQSYWMFTEPVESLGWTAVVVINRKETQESTQAVATFQRSITVVSVAFLSFVLILAFRVYRGTEKAFWLLSIFVSIIFLAGIVATWILSVTGDPNVNMSNVRVVDAPSAEAAIRNHLASSTAPDEVVRIPTGVFVQSLRFTGANNVLLTGYIWQRKTGDAANLETLPGVILPEAEEVSFDEPIETNVGGSKVTHWYFTATLRQQFDYWKYPFDREDAWLRLWPNSFDRNHILVPDFEGYSEWRPEGKPGLEQDFVLEGWKTVNSYFSYRINPYNVHFGQPGSKSGQSLELYFNVGLRRNFIGPFVADIIPLVVIAFLVFAVLMIATRIEKKIDLLGFSTSAVLGYCAALFFVVIVSHVHLRETLSSQGIIYMDYFYFVMYFAILWVSTDSLLFSSSRSIPLIHFGDNLIVKLIYWPVLLGSLFAITLLVFW
jgi:hypothetical protein